MLNLYGYVELLKSKGYDYEFIYTPFSYEGFGKKFHSNQLFMYYHKTINNHREDYIELCKRWDDMLNYSGVNVKQVGESELTPYVHAGFMGEKEYDCFNHTRKIKSLIKEKFNIKTQSPEKKIIGIHMRRGDVTSANHPDRWLSDEYYIQTIELLKNKYPNHKIKIYTQRRNFNEEMFSNFDIFFDDMMLDNQTWLELINCDVLVIGKSAFSYSAGILCDGLVIYPNDGDMFHPKLEDWITINEL